MLEGNPSHFITVHMKSSVLLEEELRLKPLNYGCMDLTLFIDYLL